MSIHVVEMGVLLHSLHLNHLKLVKNISLEIHSGKLFYIFPTDPFFIDQGMGTDFKVEL